VVVSESPNKAAEKDIDRPAKPAATRDLPPDAFSSVSRSNGGKAKDYDSVILDLDSDEHEEPTAGTATTPDAPLDEAKPPTSGDGQERTLARSVTPPRISQELVRAAALDQIGPEHFRRTLIAPARSATSAPVGRPSRSIRIATHPVEAQLEDRRLLMVHEPDSPRAAAMRVLRHRLVERGDPRTIVVTSPDVGDGKTTCAANLAITLSECGRARVLLLEGNFRRPALASVFGIKPPICLTAQMTDHHRNREADPWAAAQVISPWLHLLAIDSDTFRGPRLIDGPAFENTMTQLKLVGYDYIVVDTPAVLGSADVNLVQELADGVVLALTAKRSSTRSLRAAVAQLTQAKILGVALLEA
jgi:Mrp family chromosome partitioning ATPase